MVIFNCLHSLGSLDEKAITNLSFIANLSNHVRVNSSTSSSNNSLDDFFPSFLWIVRDFSLELVDEDGDDITTSEYLERALAVQEGYDVDTLERNRVRSMMTSFFKKRDCVTIVRPVDSEEELQQIDTLPISSLRPEFQQQLTSVKKRVFTDLVPKRLEGADLNGSMYANLITQYVDAINSGGIPTITTAWEAVLREECRVRGSSLKFGCRS